MVCTPLLFTSLNEWGQHLYPNCRNVNLPSSKKTNESPSPPRVTSYLVICLSPQAKGASQSESVIPSVGTGTLPVTSSNPVGVSTISISPTTPVLNPLNALMSMRIPIPGLLGRFHF